MITSFSYGVVVSLQRVVKEMSHRVTATVTLLLQQAQIYSDTHCLHLVKMYLSSCKDFNITRKITIFNMNEITLHVHCYLLYKYMGISYFKVSTRFDMKEII